jgi:hypothetical protein
MIVRRSSIEKVKFTDHKIEEFQPARGYGLQVIESEQDNLQPGCKMERQKRTFLYFN